MTTVREVDPYLIEREQLAVLVRQSRPAALATVAIAGVLAAALWATQSADRHVLIVWYAAMIVASFSRALVAAYLKRRPDLVANPRPWLKAYVGLASLAGAGWCAASLLYLVPDQPTAFVLCVLALGGTASGATGSLSAYLPAYDVFLLLALVPLGLRSAWIGGPVGWSVALMALPYLLASYSFARTANRALTESIRLRFVNEELVREVIDERNRAVSAQERAEQAVIAQSKFLAAASHDLRQPAHALSLFLGSLEPRVASDPQSSYIVDRIGASTAALKSLLDGLFDISRLDAGTVTPIPRAMPLLPLLQKIAAELAPAAADKGLALHLAPTSLWVRSDPEMLERIVRNLVTNAVRYTTSGKVLIGCRRGDPVRLCVWDTGVGIPLDQTEEIFIEFRQLHNPQRDRSMGLGLGLAIVRRLAELLGHGVRVQSRPGLGSCFSVELPLAAPAVLTGGQPTHEAPQAARRLHGTRVLVVDDDPLAREALCTLLSSWGCSIGAASSVEEAAAMATNDPEVALALVDFRLGENRTGLDAIRAIEAAAGKPVKAIIITGDTAPNRIREAERTGYALLHKPLTATLLSRALETALQPPSV